MTTAMMGRTSSIQGGPQATGRPAASKRVGMRPTTPCGPCKAANVTQAIAARANRLTNSRALRIGGLPLFGGYPSEMGNPKSAKAGALYALAKVFAFHLDTYAHFGQPGAHAVADAVAEGGLAGGAFGIGQVAAPGRQIGIIGGDDGGETVVVAGVEDERDGVPDPLVGLLRAQIVENQHFCGEDRPEQIEFGGVD